MLGSVLVIAQLCSEKNSLPALLQLSLFTNSIWHINLGYCYKTVNKKIEVRLNRIVRIATFSSIYTPINTMYKQLNILKISDHLELGKFMYQLYSDRLPAVFIQLFKKIKELNKQKNQLFSSTCI